MLEDEMPRVEQHLCFALYATLHAAHRVYAPLLGSIGLTYPQYLVMLVLWEGDDMTVKAIGERLHLDSGTLTPLLKRLEANGLLGRARDPKDERQVRIKLSQKGRDLRRLARPIPEQLARAMGRSPDDLKAMRKELRRIRNALLGRRDKPEKPEKVEKVEKVDKIRKNCAADRVVLKRIPRGPTAAAACATPPSRYNRPSARCARNSAASAR